MNIILFILLSSLIHFGPSLGTSICDLDLDQIDWTARDQFEPDMVTANTKLENAFGESFIVNTTISGSLSECARACCAKINCHFAYIKESSICYLITCLSDEKCHVVPNEIKQKNDQTDFMIKIRTVDNADKLVQDLLAKEKTELSKINFNVLDKHCMPNATANSACQPNELCLLNKVTNTHECICPRYLHFIRMGAHCRQYMPNTSGCVLNLNECNQGPNEECLTLNDMSKHGTCQCRVGFSRNSHTMQCEAVTGGQQSLANSMVQEHVNETKNALRKEQFFPQAGQTVNIRRRPSPPGSQPEENQFLNEILNELNKEQAIKTETINKVSSPTPTTTTKTILTTNEVAIIRTDDLVAVAGEDIHVWYPSRTCTLNGTQTRVLHSNKQIVRWQWSKHESSPAFGQWVNGNSEYPIVTYENLIAGVYKFILRVWTNTNDFSQDLVNVYVHLLPLVNTRNINDGITSTDNTESSMLFLFNNSNLAENLIQIELDIQPDFFSEFLKQQFLAKLEVLLNQQSDWSKNFIKLINPRVFVINTKIQTNKYINKSMVVLEFIVTDNQVVGDNAQNKQIVKSDLIVRELRRKQKYLKFNIINTSLNSINSMLHSLNLNPSQNSYLNSILENLKANSANAASVAKFEDFLDIKVLAVSQVTCLAEEYMKKNLSRIAVNSNLRFNCSNHGTCDQYSRKCMCNKYYMSNMFMHYFNYEGDLTDGNNCDLNIPIVILCTVLVIAIAILLTIVIFRYFLYYIFCCCFCCKGKKMNVRNKYKKFKDNSYYEDDGINEDNSDSDDHGKPLSKSKRKSSKGVLSSFRLSNKSLRTVPNSKTKYSLLKDTEDEKSFLSDIKQDKTCLMNENPKMSALNEDEDVLYDKSMLNSTSMSLKEINNNTIKKYSNLI